MSDLYGAHAFYVDIVPTVAHARARIMVADRAGYMARGRGAHRATSRWTTLHELLITRDAEIIDAVVRIRRARKAVAA